MLAIDSGSRAARPGAGSPGRLRLGAARPAGVARLAALTGGAALVFYGLTRRSPAGGALAMIGGTLIYRGAGARPGASTMIRVQKSVTINRAAGELYHVWRNFENLPRFMKHLEIAQSSGGRRSHWVATAPLGAKVTWDAEITEERESEVIAWRALPSSDVANAGRVEFHPAPEGGGTEVTVTLEYEPPAGEIGAAVATLFGEEPRQQVQDGLRRFKLLMEAGEIPPLGGRPVTPPAS